MLPRTTLLTKIVCVHYYNYVTWDKPPAPSRPSRICPVLRSHETRLALKDSFLEPGAPRESVYCNLRVRWKSRIRSTAEGEAFPLEKDSRSGETGCRSDQTNARPSDPAPSRMLCTRVDAGSA